MLTIDLLQEVIAKPLKVARYSTQFMRRRLGIGELKNTYPFSPEMFQGFVEAFKTVQGEHPSVTERIPDTTIKSSDYESSLVVFLKKHCDGTQTIKLTKAVLAAAIAFINHHPGSPLHEFMMLHQLTETLKFAGSADYEQRMLAREHAVLQQILSIHYCLDDQCNPEMPRVDRIQQALSLMSQERSVSLDQRKLALLMLESYHISSVSYASGRFDVNAHEAKNFRFILELSTIQATNELAAHATASSTRPAVNSALSRHERIQTVTVKLGENVETISQPKTLGPLWEAFFEKLFNASRGKDPVAIMTEVVMGNFLINSSAFTKPLQAWFSAFDQYYAGMNGEDIISRNYCKLYDFMKENGQLPADARDPVRAVVQKDVVSSTFDHDRQSLTYVHDVPGELLNHQEQKSEEAADSIIEKNNAVASQVIIDLVETAVQQANDDTDQLLLPSSEQKSGTAADNLMLKQEGTAVKLVAADVSESNQLLADVRASESSAVEEKANDTVIATTEPPKVQRTTEVLNPTEAYQTPQKKRSRVPVFQPTSLSPIVEGSPSGVPQSSGKKNETPRSENLSPPPFVLDAEPSAVERSVSVAVQDSESFTELLAMKKPQEVEEKGALGGLAGKAANTVTRFDEDDDNASTIGYSDVGSEYSYNEDEAVFFYVPEFSPENSDFANKFIQAIQYYYSSDSEFSDKNAIVVALINTTLSWYEQAKKRGVIARAPQALHELNKLLQTTEISLDNAYRYLYAILHATVFATRLRQAKVEEIRSFYQDAGATLMQLSAQVASEEGLPAHTWMLQQVDSTHRTVLEILTYKDEQKVRSVHENSVLSNTNEHLNAAAVSILEKLPFIWQSLYPLVSSDRAVDFKRVEKRRRVEALCADVLARILAKTPGTLTIAEQALVVRVAEDYASQTTTTPFYNAFRFLVVTHHDVETGVALVGSELAIERGKMLYGQLFSQLRLFDLAGSSRQEQVMTEYLTAYVEKLQPTVSVVSDSIDWDITSDASGRKSTKSSGSAYSYKSAGSGKSAVSSGGMHARAFEKAGVINEAVKGIWSTTVLKASLSKNEVKFILKNYEGMCRETNFDNEQSTLLLHRAFDWLRELPSTQRDISTGGMFSRVPKEIEDIASDDYNGLMGYVISKKGVPELFVRYCEYQVARMSQSGKVMKTYEIKFIMQNLRSLCIHKDALDNGEALVASTLNLVSAEWNKQLAKLEAKTTLASEDVTAIKAHYDMTHDDNKPSKRLKGNQVLKDVCDRVSALYDRAHPKSKSSAAVGKNK